jgi:glucose/arabinose dehydrogenase
MRTRPSLAAAACGLAAVSLLAACASGTGAAGTPNWKPKPSFSGEGFQPGNRQPVQPQPRPSTTPGGSPSSGRRQSGDPAVVAKNLTTPTGVAILPDNTALVGERTTGRIVRVQPQPNQPVQTVRTIPHLDTAGDGGLLDLAISPNYAEDNLIFAYITTRKDNRVVDFTLKGPVTTVLSGIPRGSSDNTGRLAFTADGNLFVGTGDAGRPALAANPDSLAGKVLRITDIGKAAGGNPVAGSRVYALGLRRTDGLCGDRDTGRTFQTESLDTRAADPINELVSGADYGWPTVSGAAHQPLATLPDTSRDPGGCAVLAGVLYTTSLDGTALLSAQLQTGRGGTFTLGAFTPTLRNRYGRLRTVVAAADGALWLTTSNRDGHGKPVAADERVIRVVPSGGAQGNSPL